MALSDLIAPSLQAGATILTAGSQLAKGAAARSIAAQRQQALEYEARQLETEATQSRSVGMRAAQDQTLNAEMVNSTALARAAASGAGASDPTVMAIIARTAGTGAYRAALANYEGEAQARLDMARAGALRFEGRVGVAGAEAGAKMAGIGAGATILSGAVKTGSLMQRFWPGSPVNGKDVPQTTSGTEGSFLDAGTKSQDVA